MLFPLLSLISVTSDRPKQPKKPWFQEFTTASCSLNWDKPDCDGGAEITKYIIQRRENHADWKLYTNFTPQVNSLSLVDPSLLFRWTNLSP